MIPGIFVAIIFVVIFIIVYRKNTGTNVYKYITAQVGSVYDKYAPYSFKVVRDKVKKLGQEYTSKQYAIQIIHATLLCQESKPRQIAACPCL